MTTSFLEVYNRAISSLDDPALTNGYSISPIGFYKIMYNFLQLGIPRFTNPLSEIGKLNTQNLPIGYSESFTISGSVTNYPLSTTPVSNSLFQYSLNGASTSGSYTILSNTVSFDDTFPGQTAIAEWYFPGEFVNDLGSMELVILSKLTVLSWMEKEKNFLLDIRRVLQDTDFKLGSEANSVRAKMEWFYNAQESVDKLMQQYSWSSLSNNYFTNH
jgi:hypothetical protein